MADLKFRAEDEGEGENEDEGEDDDKRWVEGWMMMLASLFHSFVVLLPLTASDFRASYSSRLDRPVGLWN